MMFIHRLLRFLRLVPPPRPVTTDEQMEELRRALEKRLAEHDEARHG